MPFIFLGNITPTVIHIITTLLTLSIIVVLTTYLIYFPAKKSINERKKFIKTNIDESIEKNKQADKFMEEAELKIKESVDDSKYVTDTAKAEAKRIKEDIIEQAQEEINQLKERLVKEKTSETESLKAKINQQIIDAALEISKKVIEKDLSKEDEQKMIATFIEELENYEFNL